MGEYITLSGEQRKLGTCEDLYYTRYDDLAAAVAAGKARQEGGNLPPAEYLTHEAGFRFRFPFPDEDGKYEIGDYPDHDRGVVVALPADHPAMLKPEAHSSITHACHPKGGGYNVNVWLPCPAGEFPAGAKCSPIPGRLPIEIIQQRPMPDGALWTVCRCGYCEQPYRLSPEAALALAESIRDEHTDPQDACTSFWLKLAERIAAGYNRRIDPAAVPPPLPPPAPVPVSPPPPDKPEPARHYDRNEAITAIRAALKRRSGKAWSVTGGRGTGWGWIDISSPPARRTGEFGYMAEADRAELAALLGLTRPAHCQGVSVAPDSRAWYVRQAEGQSPTE